MRKFNINLLSLCIPILLLANTACPGVIIDNITVSFGPNGAPVSSFLVPRISDADLGVMTCVDASSGIDMCGVNFDGTGFKILLDDTNGFSEPKYLASDIN